MQFVQSIIDRGFTVFNVDANKRPCNKSGYMLKGWESISADDVKAHHNYDSLQWGLRTGVHSNGRAIMSLDFDCCGKPVSGVRIGCNYTKTKLATWMDMGNMDGTYESSTLGNMNVLVDYTDCPTLVNATRGRGKYTRKGTDLEVLMGSGCQQVIPPSTTKCKISGLAERSRTFLNENPLLVVREGSAEMEFILSLITEAKAEAPAVPKRRVVKRKIASVSDADTETDTTAPADKWLDLLNNVIGNDSDERGVNVVDWDTWFKIAGILKSNKYSKDVFMKYSAMGENCSVETASSLWDGIKKTNMSIHGLQNIAKEIDPDAYAKWLSAQKTIRIANNDSDAADMILDDLGDTIRVDHKGRLWLVRDHVWNSETDKIETALKFNIMNSEICSGTVEKPTAYAKNTKSVSNIYTALLIKVKCGRVDADLYENFRKTTVGRIAFADGVLDMKAKRFYTWDEIDFPYFTTLKIDYEFGEYYKNPDRVVMSLVNETIYKPLFNTQYENGMLYFSRALGGHVEDKSWGSYLGNRNCGKSVLYDSLKSAYQGYVDSFDLLNIMYERKRDIEECARKKYWMLELEWVRVAMSQEIPEGDALKADGEKIKGICSGGDNHKARRNFDKVDTNFKISASLFILGNNELIVDKQDTFEHCLQLSSTYQFKSAEHIAVAKAEYPDNPLMWDSYRVKDDRVKTEYVHSDAWKKATVMLMCEAYKNHAVILPQNTESSDGGIRGAILGAIKITGLEGDVVLCSVVYEALSKWGKKKVAVELESMGVKKVKQQNKNVSNYGKWRFIGVVVKKGEEEDEVSASVF